ncbi:MAG TPA: energy transducer TonB [Bryobacteraceae bacterium]|nr:energy transducer TonB [Bryobacteraceae bacterium]
MRSRLLSLAIHLCVVALLILISSNPALPPKSLEVFRPSRYQVNRLVAAAADPGGGGGGEHSLLRASRGRLPKPAPRQFTPPSAIARDTPPILPVEPTLVMPPGVQLPTVNLALLGDPNGVIGPPSNGRGTRGGIGDGYGGGVGDHRGPGYGDHDGGGISGSSFTGRLTAPVVLYKIDPEFSEEARKAKYQGIVVLTIEIGTDGLAHSFHILRGLGMGLDEKAIEAVSQWKFRPALRNGRPVSAPATIEVNFRLL